MDSKIKEIKMIIRMKRDQGDFQSVREAQAIEKMIDEALRFAQSTLTEFGQKEIDKKLNR